MGSLPLGSRITRDGPPTPPSSRRPSRLTDPLLPLPSSSSSRQMPAASPSLSRPKADGFGGVLIHSSATLPMLNDRFRSSKVEPGGDSGSSLLSRVAFVTATGKVSCSSSVPPALAPAASSCSTAVRWESRGYTCDGGEETMRLALNSLLDLSRDLGGRATPSSGTDDRDAGEDVGRVILR